MRNKMKGFIAGVLITLIIMANPLALAQGFNQTISVLFNSLTIKVNGSTVNADNILYNGTTYVPLRAVSEALGREVSFDGATSTVNINDPKTPAQQASSNNSRTNPAKVGETLELDRDDWLYGKSKIQVTLTEVISGDQAWQIVKEANMFNKELDSDEEYILAKFKVKVLENQDNKPLSINRTLFDVISKDGILYSRHETVAGLTPDFRTDIYPGGEHEGFVAFTVKKNDTPVVAIDRGKASETWFNLR
ncbi:stalk domain-containing protein [Alkaliphilus transvaalensis]|uniref:stalk domain-containing protein n=1 Tax=Alkaliphilus transvaalensis TaxID=114628 RepID=UPI00047E2CF6|nr:stalk domain-containing protein [Alkaliphilus transvaalensis]